MSDLDAFSRLAPFIQEYIYAQGWTEFKAVQLAASRAILQTDDHLLLASGTASGKTEAAFLPILTLLCADPPSSVGVLYIGPTKALINDQFQRLTGLLREAEIPVWHWHGDVDRTQKQKLRQHPRGVLQITPESLESLLLNHGDSLGQMFSDLRFVIIDEVHVFMGSDRGQQIICQLHRLRQFCRNEPRRVGLSATLGDCQIAERWLALGSERPVYTPSTVEGGKRLRLSLQHFARSAADHQPADALQNEPYYRYIWQLTASKKALIFANNRAETEHTITALRQIAEANAQPDIYHVHHGSISAALRMAAEEAMRDQHRPAVTAATLTLELGIDLGELELVVQLDSPPSVSSFLQRLGRSGRRGGPAEMRLVSSEVVGEELPLALRMPWQLLQSIAVIELYLRERWIEPASAPRLPCSLLYQQTMSTLLQAGSLRPEQLAKRVLSLPPFAGVSQADFRGLLLHLLSIDHLERLETGELLVGLAGEKLARDWHFYSVFRDTDEYLVRDAARDIGRIGRLPMLGDRLALAGRSWEVVDIDSARRIVSVVAATGQATVSWSGSSALVHSRVLQQIQQILLSDEDYRYLLPAAATRLQAARQIARQAGFAKHLVVPIEDRLLAVVPWIGTRAFGTMERILRNHQSELGIRGVSSLSPYYFLVQQDGTTARAVESALQALIHQCSGESLLGAQEAPQTAKYDQFIPLDLLRRSYILDQLAVEELRTILV